MAPLAPGASTRIQCSGKAAPFGLGSGQAETQPALRIGKAAGPDPGAGKLILDSINGVSLGTLTAGFTQEANIGTTDVQIAMCNLGALPEGSGSVVVLLFRVSFEAQPGDIFTISVQDVSLKGPYGESFDWTGTVDSTDGTVTVKGIVDLPLVVRVLDNTTHLPIAGSTLAVSQVGGSGSPLITEVADGIFQVMGLETTTYQFFAQATGFTNYTETRGINAAEQSQIDLAMSKSGAGGCHAGALNAPETTSADWADLIQLLLVIGLLLSLRKTQRRCPKH